MLGPIGWPELVLILVVVLVIFGPGKLPDVGNAIGRGIREFRKASNELEESVRGEPRRSDSRRAEAARPVTASGSASGSTSGPASAAATSATPAAAPAQASAPAAGEAPRQDATETQ